jgi:hypothetical protein
MAQLKPRAAQSRAIRCLSERIAMASSQYDLAKLKVRVLPEYDNSRASFLLPICNQP